MSEAASLSRRMFVGMLLAASLAPLGSTMIAVALPLIGDDLGLDRPTLTQWLATTYLVISLLFQPSGGRLGDRIGHRRNMMLGMSIYGVGTIIGFVDGRLPALVAARVSMAFGTALMVPSAVAQIRASVDPAKRSNAFGAFGASMGLAAAFGPLLGGELTQAFGWRSIFIAPLPQIALAAMMLRGAASEPPPPREAFNWRVDLALFDSSVLRRRHFAAGGIISAFNNLAMYALLFQLPMFFASIHPGTVAPMGRSLMALMLAMVVCSPLGARLANHVGARLTVTIGVLMELAAIYLFQDLPAMGTPAEAMPALALLGGGLGMCVAPGQTAAMNSAKVEEAGIAAGMLSTLRYLGGVAGIGVLGLLLEDSEGAVDLAQHARPIPVYACALLVSLTAAQFLPGRTDPPA